MLSKKSGPPLHTFMGKHPPDQRNQEIRNKSSDKLTLVFVSCFPWERLLAPGLCLNNTFNPNSGGSAESTVLYPESRSAPNREPVGYAEAGHQPLVFGSKKLSEPMLLSLRPKYRSKSSVARVAPAH